MIAIKRIINILLALVFLCNCTVTNLENNKFSGHYIEQKNNNKDNVYAYIPIYNSVFEKEKVSLLRDRIVKKEPFFYYLTIRGNFEKIEKINAFFIQNKKRIIEIPITEERLNNKKRNLKSKSDNYLFPHGQKQKLPISWNKTKTLEVEVNFTGIKNGVKKQYKLRGSYKKKSTTKNINLTWQNIMGI